VKTTQNPLSFRGGGEPVSSDILKSYAETLAQYHLHPESKFLNGSYGDKGTTLRRHVQMSGVHNIGKESNDWETQAVLDFDPDAAPDYGLSPDELAAFPTRLQYLAKVMGSKYLVKRLGISPAILGRLKSVKGNWHDAAANIAPDLISKLEHEANALLDQKRIYLDDLHNAVDEEGWRPVARKIGTDASNLRRKIAKLQTIIYPK
jgi:hypothetical protein